MAWTATIVFTAALAFGLPASSVRAAVDYDGVAEIYGSLGQMLGIVERIANVIERDTGDRQKKVCAHNILGALLSVHADVSARFKVAHDLTDMTDLVRVRETTSQLAGTIPASLEIVVKATPQVSSYGHECSSHEIDNLVSSATKTFEHVTKGLNKIASHLKDEGVS